MAEWLTPTAGRLKDAVTKKLDSIDLETDGAGATKHRARVKRRSRDIDGGQTANEDLLMMSGSKSNRKAAHPLLYDQDQTLTRDQKTTIVKAEHLGGGDWSRHQLERA